MLGLTSKGYRLWPGRCAGLIAGLILVQAAVAYGHESTATNFERLSSEWVFQPGIVIPLVLSGALYLGGFLRLRKVSPQALGGIEAWSFLGGWITLVVALLSPLHPWGSMLFSAHMTQHELLMLVAAPLLVLGRPLIPFLWALPRPITLSLTRSAKWRVWRAAWALITAPFAAWLIHAIVLWVWHIPALFQATLHDEFVHALQHISFLGSALLFWWAVIHGRQRAMGFGAAVLYMFTTALHSGLLGALLTFARRAWYPAYNSSTFAWGLTPLQDQQLGGLIMWIPAGVVYIIAGLVLFAGWLRESERRTVLPSLSSELVEPMVTKV